MDEDGYWKKLSFVKRSSQREAVLQETDSPSMPSEIADRTGMHNSHVSRALTELRERDLVTCLNPEDHRGRLYRATEEGEWVLDEL